MVSSKQALERYGDPGGSNEGKYMTIWVVPADIRSALKHVRFSAMGSIGFPEKIYINKDFQPLLEKGLRNVISRGLAAELKTWDGVYIIRKKRLNNSPSMHSWGIAFDCNAFENLQGNKPKLSTAFAQCFIDAGMDWGGLWAGKSVDGMHFQISSLP